MERQAFTRRERRLIAEVEISPFCWSVREFVRERGEKGYTGSATWILANLNQRATEAQRSAPEWPKNPNQLGRLLNKYQEGLRLKGVRVNQARHGFYGRMWTLESVVTKNFEMWHPCLSMTGKNPVKTSKN